MLGVSVSQTNTGVDLKRPFDMKLKVDNSKETILKNLTVFLNPFVPDSENSKNTKNLVIFIDNGEFDNRQIGAIRIKCEKVNIFKYTWKSVFSILTNIKNVPTLALAQENKFFGIYQNKKTYTQMFVGLNTIRRIFDDGSILEYKIDSNGIAIPESFKWIKK